MKKARERTQEQGTQTPFPGPGLNAAQNQDHLSHELVIGTVNGATSQSLSDEDLLHRIKQYDQAAWSELYKRYFQDLLRFQRWGKDDAEDLAQEVMYRVCRCAHSFRGGSFLPGSSLLRGMCARIIGGITWVLPRSKCPSTQMRMARPN